MDYALRAGISYCEVGGRLLFLDIDADRYFALGRATELSLSRAVADAPLDGDDLARLAGLVERGVLSPAANDRAGVAPCIPPPPPKQSLLDLPLPPPRAWATLAAIAATTASIARLQRRPLRNNLAAAIAHRGLRESAEPRMLGAIAAAFERASHVLSTHDRCLAQSLAIARSVSARGGWIQIVIGVTLGPFGAHCWVQSGSVVVNDRIDRVAGYTPILVV